MCLIMPLVCATDTSHYLRVQYLVRLIVQHYQVAVADVEAREVFTSVLCVKDVLIHYKGRSTCVGSSSPVLCWCERGKQNRVTQQQPQSTCISTQQNRNLHHKI